MVEPILNAINRNLGVEHSQVAQNGCMRFCRVVLRLHPHSAQLCTRAGPLHSKLQRHNQTAHVRGAKSAGPPVMAIA